MCARLHPQVRFGAQPTLKAAALSAEMNRQGCLKVNCRKAAREDTLGCARSITRPQAAELQSNITIILLCNSESSLSKKPKGFF